MGFDALIAKVQQAEAALEARERHTGAQWRQLKTSWRAAWTPGRIVVAGLGAGFLVGHARPLRLAGSGGALQLLTTLADRLDQGRIYDRDVSELLPAMSALILAFNRRVR